MNWWTKFSAWVSSGNGIVETLGVAGGLFLTVYKFGGRVWAFLCHAGRTLRYHWNFQEHIFKEFSHIDKRLDRIAERLEDVEDGTLNGILVRRRMMEIDQKLAWFEASPSGRFEWINGLWRQLTGLSIEEASGEGWINGVAEKERESILRNWKSCVSKQIQFDRQLTFVHRTTGMQTRVRLTADPGKKGKGGIGDVVLYVGHAVQI